MHFSTYLLSASYVPGTARPWGYSSEHRQSYRTSSIAQGQYSLPLAKSGNKHSALLSESPWALPAPACWCHSQIVVMGGAEKGIDRKVQAGKISLRPRAWVLQFCSIPCRCSSRMLVGVEQGSQHLRTNWVSNNLNWRFYLGFWESNSGKRRKMKWVLSGAIFKVHSGYLERRPREGGTWW